MGEHSKGTVYRITPGLLTRIVGQPPLSATIYELEKLRCQLCGETFTATAPDVGDRKYDATAGKRPDLCALLG